MPLLERSKRLAAPAAEVWALIGPFDGLANWHPAVIACHSSGSGEGQEREVVVVGSIRLKERLVAQDDAAMRCRYVLVDGPLPVEGYVSTLSVSDNGDETSTVTWSAEYQLAGAPEDVARDAIGGIYDAGLQSLGDRFGAG